MAGQDQLGDLDLAALISSRICHDVISPVGAISNGLEVLDEENDEQVRAYALDLIRRSADQASAKLQFARLAFGAAGSAGTEIGLPMLEDVARGILDPDKHTLDLSSEPTSLAKDKVKLLLNLFAVAITALPRGGTMTLAITGDTNAPQLSIRCAGDGVRMPARFEEIISGKNGEAYDSMSIQPYYTTRVAADSGMALEAHAEGDEIVLKAMPAN